MKATTIAIFVSAALCCHAGAADYDASRYSYPNTIIVRDH
jgi:hypothetical protein